jgi:hypothetical protein
MATLKTARSFKINRLGSTVRAPAGAKLVKVQGGQGPMHALAEPHKYMDPQDTIGHHDATHYHVFVHPDDVHHGESESSVREFVERRLLGGA